MYLFISLIKESIILQTLEFFRINISAPGTLDFQGLIPSL